MNSSRWWRLSCLFSRHLDHPCLHTVPNFVLALNHLVQPCSETDQEPIKAKTNPAQIIAGSNSDQLPSHK